MNALNQIFSEAQSWPDSEVSMPVLFVGHGAPLYALGNNPYANAWQALGQRLPRPKAVISISAHWLTPGKSLVTLNQKPKTIYDFGRFDDRLFEIDYPAPGDPKLARYLAQRISEIKPDLSWGYDHGTWCVLHHMYPQADIPVLQLSIDYAQGGSFHFALGEKLRFLRKKGVLILGSGNIVHNLRKLSFPESSYHPWAEEFDLFSAELINDRNFKALIDYQKLGTAASLSIPTPDHYFPLLYVLGLAETTDTISFPISGLSYGGTSMRSVLIES